mgnify:CR=1 FL=1
MNNEINDVFEDINNIFINKLQEAREKTNDSIEIELSNGNFETFLVNDDDVKTALSKKSEGSKITFTYGAVEGQANKEILSVK